MKKILFSLCIIASTCSVFAAANAVSLDSENFGGVVGSSISYCPIDGVPYPCNWLVKNKLDTTVVAITGDRQQTRTEIKNNLPYKTSVSRDGSFVFTVTINGVTKNITSKSNYISINKNNQEGGFGLSTR